MEAVRESRHGRYQIVGEIGRGSTGPVYLARDLSSARDVALKTLSEAGSLDDGDLEHLRRLFLNEASARALLSHPGIVQVHDLIDEPGQAEILLVMEYVAGSTLAEVLARPDPLPFDFVVNVVREVAAVLDHVHAHGVVHRDIKPANILISADAGIKVTDFGISDLGGQGLAEELKRAGSPNYMAPERVLGTGGDASVDIWALGVVLYEMLARRLPFQGESVAELVTAIAADPPAPLGSRGIAAIPGLRPIVARALAKEPQDRYSTAGELARALAAVQAGQTELSATLPAGSIPPVASAGGDREAERATAGADLGLWRKRLGRLVPGRLPAAAGAVVLLALAGLWLGAGGQTPGESDSAAPGASTEGERRRFEYLALLEEAQGLLERGDQAGADELFARAEVLSPDARRIRALRDQARRQAASEVAAEIEVEVAALVGMAGADLAEGRLADAAESVRRALKLSPEHPRALALQTLIEDQRQAIRALQARARPVALAPASPPAPTPVTPRIERPIQPPAASPAPTHSDLRIDFHSELARGVVTIYKAESQVFRRPFRFVEKKGFLRTRGVRGGFDEQVRVKAGPSEFRVYLSLPNRETQVRRISGILPPAGVRTLRLRVDAEGVLAVTLH